MSRRVEIEDIQHQDLIEILKTRKNETSKEINKNNHQSATRKTTGRTKKTRLYSRTIKEYQFGIVCKFCQLDVEVTTYKASPPKFCGLTCRQQFYKKNNQNK